MSEQNQNHRDDTDHFPVMCAEILTALRPVDGGVYIDGTFGAGGYTRALLEAADCTVLAIDRDEAAQPRAASLQEEFGARLVFMPGCFGDAAALAQEAGYNKVDGFVLDLGVSSMQIDQPERGFSFRYDGPLDMRMGRADGVPAAADVVNEMSEEDLIHIIRTYGQERFARRVARRIITAREEQPIETTAALADIVRSAVPRSPKDKIDPATRTFQALRIYVNDELGELARGLVAAEKLLRPEGRLVVVSFHSLEDSIVKDFLYRAAGRKNGGSRHLPALAQDDPRCMLPRAKAIFPSEQEIRTNSRSRSARMRVGVRTDAPPRIESDRDGKGARI